MERQQFSDLQWPGVYVLARSDHDISARPFAWSQDIIYVGMTNCRHLKKRLDELHNTLAGREGHGGGCRIRYKYPDYRELAGKLYVAVWPVPCDVKRRCPDDLRAMGEIAKLEYVCVAKFVELFRRLSEINDKKRAPKGKRA